MTAPAGSRLPRRLGAAIIVLAWAPAIAASVLLAAGDPEWAHPLRVIVAALVYAPVAAILLAHRRPAVAAILAVLAVNSGWLALLVALRSSAVVDASGAVDLLQAVLVWPRVPEVAALAVLPWLLVARRTRLRTAGIALGVGVVVLDAAMSTAALVGGRPLGPEVLVTLFGSIALFAGGTIALVSEWRHTTGPRRAALASLGLGAVLLVASYVPIVVGLPDPVVTLGHAAFVLASGVLPTAVLAVALGGDVAADPRLLAATVRLQAIAVAASLSLVVLEAGTLLGLDGTTAGAVAAGALALAFGPVSRFVRRRTEAMVAPVGADPRDLLHRLGRHLADAPDPAEGLRGLAEALRTTWLLDSVTIEADRGGPGGGVVVARVGAPGAERLAVDLRAGGRRVGVVRVTGGAHAVLQRSVRPALEEISGLLAVAVLLTDINDDVADTRRRMLGVRHEERRLLHRELRDELAPSLAGLGYGIAAARRLIGAGSPSAVAAVAALRVDVAGRAEDVRRLARALLPAALDEGDLDAALRELAQRSTDDGRPVTVDSAGADVLDDRTQLAVYLLAAEAVRHLRANRERGGLAIGVRIRDDVVVVRFGLDVAGASEVDSLRAALAERSDELGAGLRTDAAADSRAVEAVILR